MNDMARRRALPLLALAVSLPAVAQQRAPDLRGMWSDPPATLDETGAVKQWEVEFDGRLNLTNGGWTDDTVKVGERLTVTGNPTHTGSPRMFFMSLQRADGSTLLRPAFERLNALEQDRRRRIEQRNQQDKPQ